MILIGKVINIDVLNDVKEWLEYTPEWWDLEEIFLKRAVDLTDEELGILVMHRNDLKMLEDVSNFIDLANKNGENVSLRSDDADKLDSIYDYASSSLRFEKISDEEKEFVDMLFSEDTYNNEDEIDVALNNIQSPFLRKYAEEKRPYFRTNRTSGKFKSRDKKPHSVVPRTPNRVR